MEVARLTELRHAEVLSRSAQKHLTRPTAEPLKCEAGLRARKAAENSQASMEESKYLSRLGRAPRKSGSSGVYS